MCHNSFLRHYPFPALNIGRDFRSAARVFFRNFDSFNIRVNCLLLLSIVKKSYRTTRLKNKPGASIPENEARLSWSSSVTYCKFLSSLISDCQIVDLSSIHSSWDGWYRVFFADVEMFMRDMMYTAMRNEKTAPGKAERSGCRSHSNSKERKMQMKFQWWIM